VDAAEWQTCDDPQPMLDSLRGRVPEGRLRLFAVACCRRLPGRCLGGDDWRHGIDVAERYATGRASRDEVAGVLGCLTRDFEEVIESDNGEIYAAKQAVLAALQPDSPFDPSRTAEHAAFSIGRLDDIEEARLAERYGQANLLRVTFGDVFAAGAG
jgi:hypothetical protein